MYRFHIEDPIRFEKSIRVTIETRPRQRARERLLEHGLLVPGRKEPASPPSRPGLRPAAEISFPTGSKAPVDAFARLRLAAGVVGFAPTGA